MKISRRDFVHAACSVAAATLVQGPVEKAQAWTRGSAIQTFGKSVLNSNFGPDWFANQAKTISSISYGSNSITANINSDGYPVGALASNVTAQMYFDSTYFGRYVLKWTGVGALSYTTSTGIIVYSGGNGVYGITPANSGIYAGNCAFINNGSQNVEFAWGTLVTGVSTAGGWVKFSVTTNYASTIAAGSSNPLAISSIVGDGTTATVTTAAPHGFPTGITVVMDILGNTPGGFNVFGAVCTITGPSTFTYSNATNATTTVAGTYAGYSRNVQFNNLTGMPTATTFKVWRADASSIIVDQSSAYAGLVSVTATGGPGTQTEAIVAAGAGLATTFPVSLPIYGTINYAFSNLIVCKKTELANVQAGFQLSTTAYNYLRALKPKFLRTMDCLSAQDFYSDFNYRMPATYLTYTPSPGTSPKIIVPSLVATMTGTGDAIQLTNPGYQTGAYVDGEIVQWTCNSSATGPNTTIQLGARGTVPLFTKDYAPRHLTLTGTITNGDVITTTFTAAWLPGGVRAVAYTVNTVSNGPAGVPDTSLQNLRANLTAQLNADSVLPAYNVQAANNANPGNGNLGNVSIVYPPSAGALTLTASVTGAGTEIWTPGYYGDTNSSLTNAQVSGTTYTAIYSGLMQGFVVVNAGSSVSGGLPAGVPLEFIKEISARCNIGVWFSMPCIFTPASWQALGQWAAQNLGAVPVICEYSNEVWNTFAAPWAQVSNFGQMIGLPGTPQQFFLAGYSYYALQVAQLLPYFVTGYTGAGGVRNNCFIANMARVDDISENPSNGCTISYRLNGQSLGSSLPSFSGSISGTTLTVPAAYEGLIAPGMVITGSGVAANTRVIKQTSFNSTIGPFRGGTFQVTVSQTVGPVTMTPTNPIWANASGPQGGAATGNYNTFPNRPVDISDTIGYAPYPTGGLITDRAISTMFSSGAASRYDLIFTAALNWKNGNTSAAYDGIDQDFNLGVNPGGSFNSYCLSGMTNAHANPGKIQLWENQLATYDGARPPGKPNLSVHQYEGGKQQCFSSVAVQNTDRATAITNLTSRFNALGWTLSPTYGSSNQDVATNLTDLFLNYHVSSQYYNTMLNNWIGAMATIHAARPNFCPAQFGIEGQWTTAAQGVPIWGSFSGELSSQQLSNLLAFQTYNNS